MPVSKTCRQGRSLGIQLEIGQIIAVSPTKCQMWSIKAYETYASNQKPGSSLYVGNWKWAADDSQCDYDEHSGIVYVHIIVAVLCKIDPHEKAKKGSE
jgi:hypothetical protein